MSPSDSTAALTGRRILIVDDEMLLAMALEDGLTALGCVTVIAPRVAKALQLIAAESFDGAMLDVNVAGEPIYPIAQELSRRGIPFVFVTGYDAARLRIEYRDRPILRKPFGMEALAQIAGSAFGQ